MAEVCKDFSQLFSDVVHNLSKRMLTFPAFVHIACVFDDQCLVGHVVV